MESANSLWTRLKGWWQGEFVPFENSPDSAFFRVGGRQERPKLATATEAALQWAFDNGWKLFTAAVSHAGLWIAWLKL